MKRIIPLLILVVSFVGLSAHATTELTGTFSTGVGTTITGTVVTPTPTPIPTPIPTPTPSPTGGGGGGGGGGVVLLSTPTPTPIPGGQIAGTTSINLAALGLKEGDTVSAAGSNDPDIYIVNNFGFKRLFLNPVIFNYYAHLGGFGNVRKIDPPTRDLFGTSGLFRNCETNDPKVWAVEVTGEDTGKLHWLNMTGDAAVAQDPDFFKKVFCINTREYNWYVKSLTNYTSLSQVPLYIRR